MWHALFTLATQRPQLLAAHLDAYAELTGAQGGLVMTCWTRRLLLVATAVLALAVAVGLGGVALLLWAALPALRLPWVLVGLPLLPLGVALACAWSLERGAPPVGFGPVMQQLRADLAMLRSGPAR